MTDSHSALHRTPGHIDLSPGVAAGSEARTLILVNYGLFIGAFVTGPITPIIGVVLAYMARGTAPEWAQSHFDFQIRTFWLSIVAFLALGAFAVVSLALTLVLIGIAGLLLLAPLGLAITIWYGVRCAVGFYHAVEGRPYPNPQGLLL